MLSYISTLQVVALNLVQHCQIVLLPQNWTSIIECYADSSNLVWCGGKLILLLIEYMQLMKCTLHTLRSSCFHHLSSWPLYVLSVWAVTKGKILTHYIFDSNVVAAPQLDQGLMNTSQLKMQGIGFCWDSAGWEVWWVGWGTPSEVSEGGRGWGWLRQK